MLPILSNSSESTNPKIKLEDLQDWVRAGKYEKHAKYLLVIWDHAFGAFMPEFAADDRAMQKTLIACQTSKTESVYININLYQDTEYQIRMLGLK